MSGPEAFLVFWFVICVSAVQSARALRLNMGMEQSDIHLNSEGPPALVGINTLPSGGKKSTKNILLLETLTVLLRNFEFFSHCHVTTSKFQCILRDLIIKTNTKYSASL